MNQSSMIRWGLAVLPGVIGIILAMLIGRSANNTLYTLSITLNMFPLLIGLFVSAFALVGVGLWEWRKRAEAQAFSELMGDAETDRRRFLQRLDHELKNPLTAIRLGLENVASADGDEQAKALASVETQANRLVRLTADIRKLSEMDTVELEKGMVDMSQLLTEVVELIHDHPDASEREVGLILPQAPWPLPNISADWDLIFLAIYNLAENAIKFTEKGDKIEVRAREDGGGIMIEVADTGPGIDEADLNHVWEELYRGFRTRSVSGSGLGLPLVKAIVERHGGTVSLDSRTELGSIFAVFLPL